MSSNDARPPSRAPGGRAVEALNGFARAVTWLKLISWTVFAAVGPVTFFLMKNYVGVAVTSGISILIALAVLGPSLSSHPLRPAFRAFLVVQGVLGAGMAAYVLAMPPAGWTHELDSTRQALAAGPGGTVVGVEFSERADVHVRGVDGRWTRESFPGGLAARIVWSPLDGVLLVPEARTATILLRPLPPAIGAAPAPGWRVLRAPGVGTDVLVTSRVVLLRDARGMNVLHLPHGELVEVAGVGAATTACASGDRVLAIQTAVSAIDRPGRAWESRDGGLTFQPEPSFAGPADHCAIADDGAAYAATSVMFGGRLAARPAGGRFVELEPPLARVEAIRVNPANGREVWIGGWGGGVFRSVDAGRTWDHLGLHGFEVESIHVDFASGLVLAATGSGIYSRRFTAR